MENNRMNTQVLPQKNMAYAGFFVRLIAYMIDSLIAGIAVGIITIPLRIASGSVSFLGANFLFQFTVIDVISYVGVAAYFVLLTYFAHSTPGKMLLHLEVVCGKDNWTVINIIYRETVGRFLSSIASIGYLAVLVTKKKQGFHDMLCDTYVVYKGMEKCEKKTTPVKFVKKEEPQTAVIKEPAKEMLQEHISQEQVLQKPVLQEMVLQEPILQKPVPQDSMPQEPIPQRPLNNAPQGTVVQQPVNQKPQQNSNKIQPPTYH